MSKFEIFNFSLNPYSLEELKSLARDFQIQCQGGQTLEMFPTHIRKKKVTGSKKNILGIDIGGTNIRAVIYDLVDGKLELRRKEKTVFKGTYTTIDKFLRFVAEFVATVTMGLENIESIGFTYSFSANIVKNHNFVDADRTGLGIDWSKGFIVEGSDINISQLLRDMLKEKGITSDKWVTINDTVALLLAKQEASLGVIVGTGYNIATSAADGQIYNTEAAKFTNDFIQSTLSKPAQVHFGEIKEQLIKLNQEISDNHSLKIFSEVQIGGGYLYRLLIAAMCIVCDCDEKFIHAVKKLESEALTIIAKGDFDTFFEKTGLEIPKSRQNNLQALTTMLIGRATDLVAAELAGAALFAGLKEDLVIAADGTLIREFPEFDRDVVTKIKQILNCKNVTIHMVDESGTLGAAYASLMDLV